MKKFRVLTIAIVVASLGVSAQDETVTPYLTMEQLPDLIKCLPAPPSFDSPEFANDMMRYAWGKQQRLDEQRAEIAKVKQLSIADLIAETIRRVEDNESISSQYLI